MSAGTRATRSQTSAPRSLLARVLLALIGVYQRTLSRLLGPSCRFHPSCSCYAATCVERFGAGRGALLAAARIARCHPFHPGGYDPPPASLAWPSPQPASRD